MIKYLFLSLFLIFISCGGDDDIIAPKYSSEKSQSSAAQEHLIQIDYKVNAVSNSMNDLLKR